jgi:ATP-dependent RNA/DNA helicase IGHMBP2
MYVEGREKECVILSLVRSNPEGEVGFLAERRRLNVAVTRARRQVTVICDSETVRRDAFLAEFLDYVENHGTLESASLHEDELPPIVRPKDVSSASLSHLKEKAGKEAAGGGGASGKIKKERDPKVAKKKTENAKRLNSAQSAKNTETSFPKKVLDPAAAQAKQDLAESLKENLMVQVEAFLASESDIVKFPCELTAQERFLVHEIAEELGLLHESVGEAKTRHIVLTKPPNEEKTKVDETVQQEIPGLSAASGSSPPLQLPVNTGTTSLVLCNNCQKSVAKANMELHKLRCQVQLGASAVNSTANQSSSTLPKKKKSAPVKKLPAASKTDDVEDFDALCEQFQTLNRVCNYEKCKTKTAVLGADCVHCRVRFCLSHALAEIHGCGEAAKLAARQQLFR